MAKDKNSFIAYCDWIDTFESLPDDKAGQLAKHLFRYVNDENPKSDDILITAVFANMKRTLKRDLIRYESVSVKRSESGKMGGRPKKQTEAKKANGLLEKQTEAKKADSDSDSDSDIKEKGCIVYFEKDKELNDAFVDYLKLRKRSKFTITDRVIKSLIKKLREYSNNDKIIALRIVENAIEGKWKSFYKLDNGK